MKKKRITLAILRKYDAEHEDSSIVRALEMEADSAITAPGYSLQFWRDVQLYGVDEAILYVENSNVGDGKRLQTFWTNLRERIGL